MMAIILQYKNVSNQQVWKFGIIMIKCTPQIYTMLCVNHISVKWGENSSSPPSPQKKILEALQQFQDQERKLEPGCQKPCYVNDLKRMHICLKGASEQMQQSFLWCMVTRNSLCWQKYHQHLTERLSLSCVSLANLQMPIPSFFFLIFVNQVVWEVLKPSWPNIPYPFTCLKIV